MHNVNFLFGAAKRRDVTARQIGLFPVFCALMLTAVAPLQAAPAASVYTVAKVRLDVSAANAVMAKEQALQEGPLLALKQMFRRVAPFRAYDRLDTLTPEEADTVIDGFVVRNERNSSTRYLALLDYSFSRRKFQALLVKKGVPFFDQRSQKQVLMPVFSGSPEEGSEDNNRRNSREWWRAWRTIDMKHALTDTRLYKPKGSDHQVWRKIRSGESEGYGLLQRQYAVERLILVDARLNGEQNRLTLHLYGEDQRGHIDYIQEMPVENGLTRTYETAAAIAFAILEGRWREPRITGRVVAVSLPAGDGAGSGDAAEATGRRLVAETLFLRVAFRGLRDWQQIRKRLARIPGVRKMQVNSLSPRGADVRMTYPGGAGQFQNEVPAYGFALERSGKDLVLRSARN